MAVQSTGPVEDTLCLGSAQLASDGKVSGFVIFCYNRNGQEAVVPVESRNANSYILAFDNTNGTATEVAINSVSTQPVLVPVVVRAMTVVSRSRRARFPSRRTGITLLRWE